MQQIAGHDYLGGLVAAIVHQRAVDQAGHIRRRCCASVKKPLRHAAGLMALHAVHRQIAPHAPLEGRAGVVRLGVGGQGFDGGQFGRGGKITGLFQLLQLILRARAVAIHLKCIKRQRPAGGFGMAGQAFALAGIVPGLCMDAAAFLVHIGNLQDFIRAAFGDEIGIGIVRTPAVRDAVNAAGGIGGFVR